MVELINPWLVQNLAGKDFIPKNYPSTLFYSAKTQKGELEQTWVFFCLGLTPFCELPKTSGNTNPRVSAAFIELAGGFNPGHIGLYMVYKATEYWC